VLKQEKTHFHIEYMQKCDALYLCVYAGMSEHTYTYVYIPK